MKSRNHPKLAQAPTEQTIQHAAYLLWEEAGCPAGRDQEFWFAAQERLRRTVTVPTRILARPAKTRATNAQPAAGVIR
jgi:hypothetical protein